MVWSIDKGLAASRCNKSAIMDHMFNKNHVIDWVGSKVIDRESDKTAESQERQY